MKYALAAGALFAAQAYADLCSTVQVVDDNFNYYCAEVTGITYTGLEGSGSYQKVTSMDAGSGTCTQETQAYSGSMSPLDEELSLHFRGPLKLSQFAAYSSSGSSSSKKKHKRRNAGHRHGHAHFHEHQHEVRAAQEAVEKRGCGDYVTATIDGQVQSWINNCAWLSSPTASAAAATSPAGASAVATSAPTSAGYIGQASTASSSAQAAASSSVSGGWGQVAYYNAGSQIATGLTFLNNEGGQESGTWTPTFGNSLSYASADGSTDASSPQVLANAQIPASTEVIIMTDNECSNGDCGYTQPGAVAYHGFDGPEKAFFFEFEMPDDPSGSNMPAIWALNAQIPRTSQYSSNQQCSCWHTGCGELDIAEVLASGDSRMKSTIHGNSPANGGDSDYFARPTNGSITMGVILFDSNIHIKVMDSFDWSSTLAASDINSLCSSLMTQGNGVSVFPLAQ